MKKIILPIVSITLLLVAGGLYIDLYTKNNIEIKSETSTKNFSNNLKNLGAAPELVGISNWLNLPDNKQSLSLAELKGKVVLVDFWTYSCINCIRTLPYVTKWYDTYKDQGLVIIGVHTPEFAFEKETENVLTAIKNFSIKFPVAQDNDYKTWTAYKNQYWPAKYLIDQQGNIVYTHFGEGNYEETENLIRELLGLNKSPYANYNDQKNLNQTKSPEMYFGTDRLEYLTPEQSPSGVIESSFTFPKQLKLNNFALEGQWQFSPEKITSISNNSKIRLKFNSGKVFMVASSNKQITLKIKVDGKAQPDVLVSTSQLYTLFDSNEYNEHIIDIEATDAGLEAFTFTFG